MKNLIFTALFAITTLFGFSQEIKNELTIDGKNYQLEDEKAITLTKDRYDNWNLLGTIKSDGKTVAFNIATGQEKMPTGTYPLMYRIKRVETGKVAFSISIMDEKAGASAYLSMKQFSSTENGKAVIKNENGIYSITLIGVDAINIKQSRFKLDANITLDPNDNKSRKDLNKENKEMSMSKAWMNETTYFVAQSEKLKKLCNSFKLEKSSEKRDKIVEVTGKMIESNEEILKILNRPNDGSMPEKEVISFREIGAKKAEELKKMKKEINGSKISEIMDAFLSELSKGAK